MKELNATSLFISLCHYIGTLYIKINIDFKSQPIKEKEYFLSPFLHTFHKTHRPGYPVTDAMQFP